jgi:SynChlorMet cassette protein ScmC
MLSGLHLADDSTWGIVVGDEGAAGICSRLTEVMQLRSHDKPICRLRVLTEGNGVRSNYTPIAHSCQFAAPWTFLTPQEENTVTLLCPPARDNVRLTSQLMQLSLVIAQHTQAKGGFLLHGALIERDGWGVILAGPGGVGKTTASSRLRPPWRSLCDDTTLVVRDDNGKYWAHPWPTWSNLMLDGIEGTWNVEHAVKLTAIFFLGRGEHNRIDPIGAGHSVPLLVELAEQASWSMAHGQGGDASRVLRLQRFENICYLANSMNCYYLRLSLDGAFWREIERVIAGEEKEPREE